MLDISLSTISFRHQLISIGQVARWARDNHFKAIELWGAHAKNLSSHPDYNAQWMSAFNLRVSMISDSIDLNLPEHVLIHQAERLSKLAHRWQSNKIRILAGRTSSESTSQETRKKHIESLQCICQHLDQRGQNLLIETHQNTLADTCDSTVQLIKEVNHPRLKINFDALPLWKHGDNIMQSFEVLSPYIEHIHFKNIRDRKFCYVYSPQNIDSASGSRRGIAPIFEGAMNISPLIQKLSGQVRHIDASIQWLGQNVRDTIKKDHIKLRRLTEKNNPILLANVAPHGELINR